jgi:transcriptional regulator with XRE-family HTH domain
VPGFFVFSPRKLRAERKARGWSQYRLAFEAQIAQPRLCMYEAGRRTPRRETLDRLASVLGIAPADLCEEDASFSEVVK